MKKKMLLDICCAPCASGIIEELKEEFNLTLYFHNANVYPKKEWDKRFENAQKLAKQFNVPLLTDVKSYNKRHAQWKGAIRGFEDEKEGGKRCTKCFEYRLEKVSNNAKNKRFDIFATTLTISPHKNAELINKLGKQKAQEKKIEFYEADFKKNDGFKKSVEKSKELNLYRQIYCGCEYSINKKEVRV